MRTFWLVTAMAIGLAACASTQFDIPAISPPGKGEALPGKIVWHDLISDTPQQTREFYGELFGWEFDDLAIVGANYALIRHRGRVIGGLVDQNRLPATADISQWVLALSVADAERAAATVEDAGGTVFTPPTSLGDRGIISVVADPQGAVLALLQTDGEDPADRSTRVGDGEFLWNEMWSSDADASVAFYQKLASFQMEELTAQGVSAPVDYHVLSSQGSPRMGIRQRPADDVPPVWISYLRVADEAALRDKVSRVPALGGEVLVPVTQRPGGGFLAVIAGPSGAGIALQTWPEQGKPRRVSQLTVQQGGES